VIDLLPEQKRVSQTGGTMRLGLYPCRIAPGSLAHRAYGERVVYERHRHRYELNNKFKKRLGKHGLKVTGVYPHRQLAEIVEMENHPWFLAVQFHPEFQSKPFRPHPLFRDFVGAALRHQNHEVKKRWVNPFAVSNPPHRKKSRVRP
jgi:CTP synthase